MEKKAEKRCRKEWKRGQPAAVFKGQRQGKNEKTEKGATSVYKEQGREKAETGVKKDMRRRIFRKRGVYIGTRGRRRERLKGR